MILVTGGAGCIGSNIVARLCARGQDDVAIVDRLGDDDVKWRNLAHHPFERLIAPEDLSSFLATSGGSVRAVIHMGAISSTTVTDADAVARTNMALSCTLWDWCAAHERPLIYASSAATYGDGKRGFSDDNDLAALARLHPLNLYGWSKHWFDTWALRAVQAGKPRPPQWAGLKFFNVYGPNEQHKTKMMSVVAKNYARCAAGEEVGLFKSYKPAFEDGGQLRDFVYVQDCVDVIEWLLDHPDAQGLFNLGTGQARSFRDLISATFAAAGQAPRIHYIDMPESLRARYQYFTQADMGRLRAAGYDRPFTPLEVGVGDYVARYLSQADPHA